MEKEISIQMQMMETRYKRMKQFIIGFVSLTLIGLVSFGFANTDKFDLIRAKGIIIEDENGKDRILIGAPVPFSKDRVRTDTNLVRKYFASDIYPKDPNQYMEWYKKYRHSALGMVVMNKKGFEIINLHLRLNGRNNSIHDFS